MRLGRTWLMGLMAVAVLAAGPTRAEAVTLKEIMELTKAGVGDEVLLALIEIDPRVYPIDTETLSTLKQAGVSERVMVAIVKSGRTAPPAPAPSALAQDPVDAPLPPQVYIVDREPSVREVVVPMPIYVAVPTRTGGRVRHSSGVTSYDAIRSPFTPFGPLPSTSIEPVVSRPAPKPAEPVYWGWGGKRRPDTWDPDPQPRSKKK
jgi:hypothetical protein